MLPKTGSVPEKGGRKETTVYVVGEKDVQVALSRASKTEIKRAAICACAVVVTTLILVAGTLGAIALWLSSHHTQHADHQHYNHQLTGSHGNDVKNTQAPHDVTDDDGLWQFGIEGQAAVTESITDMPGAVTGAGDILIDGNERGTSQSETTTIRPKERHVTTTAPSGDDLSESASWESFSGPYPAFSETENPTDDGEIITSVDYSSPDPDPGSGSGTDLDQESKDYVEIPFGFSAASYDTSSNPEVLHDSFMSFINPGYIPDDDDVVDDDDDQDWTLEGVSGSGSGNTEISGDDFGDGFGDALYVHEDANGPKLKTPQDFLVVRYPVPISNYRTLCTSFLCTVGYMRGQDRIEVIETDLRMRPQKLTVLRKLGGELFTIIRDEDQGYRAIRMEDSGLCLLTRLENTQNLNIRENSYKPIVEKLRVTLPVELPAPLLGQIGGPIMDACSHVPVFWAQHVGHDGDRASFVNRLRRSPSAPPSGGDVQPFTELTIEGAIHFQCCWCSELDDPCPCKCGLF